MPKRRRLAGDVCAIFVHAGAGYHSVQNEKIHLRACEDAARCAMTFLNNGSSAVDAVEMAIKVLEDKEITNAGFGSNLAMNGTVECDATIVDHYGRSGAVGAAGCIRNPISLARAVLEHSTKELSLRRVPPNLLVGQGAVDFAVENNLPTIENEYLVSAAAGERHARWKLDLSKVENAEESESDGDSDVLTAKSCSQKLSLASDHVSLTGCWNESQPYSPRATAADPPHEEPSMEAIAESTKQRSLWSSNEPSNDGQNSLKLSDDEEESYIDSGAYTFRPPTTLPTSRRSSGSDLRSEDSFEEDYQLPAPLMQPPPTRAVSPSSTADPRLSGRVPIIDIIAKRDRRSDDITDTVGAIAIDTFGNIAAGSSSGGIGMKHKGRVGPAALVGIGTAVIPAEPDDKERVSVATVTSGTGEHMATTIAAGTCASRLYSSTRKTRNGHSESTDDDSAMGSFVERDFMGHPSVKHSNSSGAIGILGVKKTVDGVCLYFAHNTDSFVSNMNGGGLALV
ncbi:taspase, threonine aspartase, 1, partial [Lecanoromycetidae sp. Uapishka_2]